MATPRRFRDDGRTLSDFCTLILVECPRCARSATVVPDPEGGPVTTTSARRLTCTRCGTLRHHPAGTAAFGEPVDPYFGLPLALRRTWAGHVVWAFNHEHRMVLLAFVEADLRERCPDLPAGRAASMIERLPAWFGSAAARPGISRVLRSLAEP